MLTLVEPTPVQVADALHSEAESEQSGKHTLPAAPPLTQTVPAAQSDSVVHDGALEEPPHATNEPAATSETAPKNNQNFCFTLSPIAENE